MTKRVLLNLDSDGMLMTSHNQPICWHTGQHIHVDSLPNNGKVSREQLEAAVEAAVTLEINMIASMVYVHVDSIIKSAFEAIGLEVEE